MNEERLTSDELRVENGAGLSADEAGGKMATVVTETVDGTRANPERNSSLDSAINADEGEKVDVGAIRQFDWIRFKLEKEAFYLRDFLALHSREKLDKKSLGIEEPVFEKRLPSPELRDQGEKDQPIEFLKKRAMPDLDGRFGTKGFAKVINAIEERISKFGMLGEDDDCIRRKLHNNDEYYEQDDFIDDPVDQIALQTMDFSISRYEDYFFVKGNIDVFKKHKKLNERISEVKQRNRESKSKKNEENKKKREAQQIQSLMKPEKKPDAHSQPSKPTTKSKSKVAATSDGDSKPKKQASKSASKQPASSTTVDGTQTAVAGK